MNLKQHKTLFVIIAGVLALFLVSPLLQQVLVLPQTEFFTEFWLLGPQHTGENYPHNVTSGGEYTVFLGVKNNLGSSANYVIEVKFRNQTQSSPDSFNRTYSSLEPVYRVAFSVADNGTWEMPLYFSLEYNFNEVTRIAENVVLERVNFERLKLNDVTVNLKGLSSDFDPMTHAFYGNLVFELWIHDFQTNRLVYHERYVDLKLNMTKT